MVDSIEITRSLFSAADFVTWMRAGQLNLSPSFQRRSVWSASAKSYFIDTIVRGLPVPIIFLRTITDIATLQTKREVVDGQQRLRTIISYIDGSALRDFDEERDGFTVRRSHNAELYGKTFATLSDRLKKQILSYEFSAHILPTDTSDQQVLDIFRRMNATGVRLNNQELRNAKFFGYFSQSVNALSLTFLDYWRDWGVFSEGNIARMEEVEFTSELYILALSGVSEKSQPLISGVYARYDESFVESQRVEQRISSILELINESYGQEMGQSAFQNRIIFYPMFASLYDYVFGLNSSLSDPPRNRRPDNLDKKLARASNAFDDRDSLPEAVQEALISRSNRKSNRQALKDFIDTLLV
jgi:hypothetical protein